MQSVVVNVCEKFHIDRLRNDRSLGNGNSDNNNKKNSKKLCCKAQQTPPPCCDVTKGQKQQFHYILSR